MSGEDGAPDPLSTAIRLGEKPEGVRLLPETYQADIDRAYSSGFWHAAGIAVFTALTCAGVWVCCWHIAGCP